MRLTMLDRFRVTRSQIVPLLIQFLVVGVSYVASFMFRFDYDYRDVNWVVVARTLPLLLLVRMVGLGYFRLWRGLWRFVGVQDFIQIIRATTVSTVVFTILVVVVFGVEGLPRSVFGLDWAGNIFLLSGVRLVSLLSSQGFRPVRGKSEAGDATRVMIIGAGSAGAALCREITNAPGAELNPVVFLDDDLGKIGNTIHGVPIVGEVRTIGRAATEYEVDLVVIAAPSVTPAERRAMVEQCQRAGLDFKVLPATPDLVSGAVKISSIREVDPADLLGRPPARLDEAAISRFTQGKRVLITGAAGSIGSELAAQVALRQPELLLLVDVAENEFRFLEEDLRARMRPGTLVARVADVTDEPAIRRLMTEYRPDLVIHAAAHKHVNFMEDSPAEAVRNNVGGTYVLATCARDAGVDKFVLVSTDKAVRPTSVMGATKRLGEMIVQALGIEGPTRFASVRFGNVLGSNASVVPIFRRQIAEGGPVTVTSDEVTRYFMSIPEAAGLVLQAGAVSEGGEIFVLDMGDPVRITSLAELMISLSGKTPDEVEIVYTGLRPGEKLHEDLVGYEEEVVPTGYEKLLVLKAPPVDASVVAAAQELRLTISSLEPGAVKEQLKKLVPEYAPAPVEDTAGLHQEAS